MHVIFMIFELAVWNTDLGRGLTRLTVEAARQTANIGLNPALYNGFLGFGLFWATAILKGPEAASMRRVFLGFIAVMGVIGAIWIINPGIFVLQALPAMVAFGINWRDRAARTT